MKSWKAKSWRVGSNLPALLAAILMASGPGCASLQLLNVKPDKIPTADAEHPAIEVLAVWQAAEGPGAGGIPTRGFAGQIFFFTQDRAQPVAVDGKARIYVFDNHGSSEEQARPLRQFDFDRQSWTAHLQSSKLGATYGVFIPYPRNDYHQAICSLRVRFTPSAKGRPLFSSSSTIVLPGPPLKDEPEVSKASPLDALAKKLQSQQLTKPAWQQHLVDTGARPFATNPQMSAEQASIQMPVSSNEQLTAAPSPVPNSLAPPEDLTNPQARPQLATYSTAQSFRGRNARGNPIVQTAAVADASQAQQNGAGDNPGVPSEVTSIEGVSSSGRIKLQAFSPNTDVSSEPEGVESPSPRRPPTAWNGAGVSRPSHPLDD